MKIVKGCLALVGGVLAAVVLITACGSQSKAVMTFDTVGIRGETVFVTLVSPSADEVSAVDLANRLREDWQDQLYQGYKIEVRVFDDREAPQRWLELWDASQQEWEKEQAQIYTHWIATYLRNATTGLHQVEILSRDANGDVVRTIRFPIPSPPD